MDSTPADGTIITRKSSSEIFEHIVAYSLIAIFLCLSLPWELSPYPISLLSVVSTGAGEFFESRIFLYISILILTYLWFLSSYLKGYFRFEKTTINLPLILFLLVAIFSIFRFTDLHASLDAFFLILSYILFFYLVLNHFKSFKDIKLFIFIPIFAGAVLSLYGIFQYLIGFKELGKYIAEMSLSVDIPSRVFTIFISPNHLAGFLIMLIPLAFVLILNTRSTWKKIATLTALIMMIDCLFLTYSRGGWIGFGLVIIVLAVGYVSQKKADALINFIWIAILAVLTTFLIVKMGNVLSPNTPSYSALSASKSALSMQGRFLLWRGALKMVKTYPIRGIGLGAFASTYPLYQYGGLYSKHVHNTYLEIFAETGVFGLSLFLSIFFLIALNGLRLVKKKQGVLSELGIALLASSLGFMIHNLVDFGWSMSTAGILFWGITGLIFCCLRLTNDCQEKSLENKNFVVKKENTAIFFVVSVVILLLLLVLASSAWAQYLSNQGRTLYGQEKITSAILTLERASALDPFNPQFQSGLAGMYFKQAMFAKSLELRDQLLSKAIKKGKEAVRLRPYWAEYYAQLGIYYSYKGDNKLAIKYLKKSEILYPKNPLYRVLTGEFYYSHKDYNKAEEEFKKALALRKYYLVWYPEEAIKNFERAHFDLGLLYKDLNKFNEAEREFKEALKLNSNNKKAQNELRNIRNGRL